MVAVCPLIACSTVRNLILEAKVRNSKDAVRYSSPHCTGTAASEPYPDSHVQCSDSWKLWPTFHLLNNVTKRANGALDMGGLNDANAIFKYKALLAADSMQYHLYHLYVMRTQKATRHLCGVESVLIGVVFIFKSLDLRQSC